MTDLRMQINGISRDKRKTLMQVEKTHDISGEYKMNSITVASDQSSIRS